MLLLTLKVMSSLRSKRLARRSSHEYAAAVKLHQTCYTRTEHSDLQISDLLGMEGHYHCNKILEPKIRFECYAVYIVYI